MTTHYEQLGVTETATPAEIKRAYRAKSRQHHPDKGGTADEFAPIAQAYKVLSNPETRQLYDATGQDKRLPIDIEVQNTLMGLFNQVLSGEKDIEVVKTVRDSITSQMETIPAEQKKLTARKAKLTTKRGKIKAKGVNLVHLIIDMEVKTIDAQMANLEHQELVGKACLKALKEYSEEWEAPPPPTFTSSDFRWQFQANTFEEMIRGQRKRGSL